MARLYRINFKCVYNFKNLILLLFCFSFLPQHNAQVISRSDTVTIASWNIQMLPGIFSPFSKLVRKKQKIRSPKIIQYLNASAFDIVVLQEVFDKRRVKEFEKGLKTRYPYILEPIKQGVSLKLSSGVMILSKYPIEVIDHIIFNVSKGSDRAAQKGCSLMKIKINNKSIYLGGTHLDSKSKDARNLQYNLTKEKIISPYINDTIPFFLAGDFNTDILSEDYKTMVSTFKLTNHTLDDERPYTFDEYNSWNNKGYKSWIDFILYKKMDLVEINDQYILRPKMKFEKSTIDLADHYQIVLEVILH